jgi:hypothetical protein
MTSTTVSSQSNSTLLRNALLGNSLFSGGSGLLSLVFSSLLSPLLGLTSPVILVILGIGLMLYAVILFRISRATQVSRNGVRLAVVLDVAWVLGSVVLLLSNWLPFTDAGQWIIVIIADVVAVFAVLQFIGLRKMK